MSRLRELLRTTRSRSAAYLRDAQQLDGVFVALSKLPHCKTTNQTQIINLMDTLTTNDTLYLTSNQLKNAWRSKLLSPRNMKMPRLGDITWDLCKQYRAGLTDTIKLYHHREWATIMLSHNRNPLKIRMNSIIHETSTLKKQVGHITHRAERRASNRMLHAWAMQLKNKMRNLNWLWRRATSLMPEHVQEYIAGHMTLHGLSEAINLDTRRSKKLKRELGTHHKLQRKAKYGHQGNQISDSAIAHHDPNQINDDAIIAS